LNKAQLKSKIKEVQDLYLMDDKPWIIGYSGGKDSTCVLQLVYSSIKNLSPEKRHKEIWVICGDTLVEIPTVVERIDETLSRLNHAAINDSIPLKAQKVYPEVNKSFFVNLIGRGYPSPTRTFRWCTERLKIDPATEFIKNKVSSHGEAIIILGARKDESMSRAQSMKAHEIKNTVKTKENAIQAQLLRKHTSLASAFVYAPIEDWNLDDVWTFLSTFESPWGDKNSELVMLYQKAGGDECPLVIDTSTPSCGNSRFGCWVCTVVEQDKSIKGFIANGESWLQPMAKFRDMIAEMREQRNEHRVVDESRIGGYGAFKLSSRMLILKELFKVEKDMFDTYKTRLIRTEELLAIQKEWSKQIKGVKNLNYLRDGVRRCWDEVYNQETQTPVVDIDEEMMLAEMCEKYNVPFSMLNNMLIEEKDVSKYARRRHIFKRLKSHLDKEVKSDAVS
tara:strand:+ start:1546 stop:2892 length:1347 start_codon:yes stop_codon:yes gene_type:complete